MLNEDILKKILNVTLPPLKITDVHWKAQDADKDSILFYKLASDQKSKELFAERINNSSFGWLITNEDHPSRPANSSVIPESKWPEIQKDILDNLYPIPPIKIFAVTGTNGKTTTADLVLQIGELCGKKGMSIGTLGVREYGKTLLEFGLTSPSFIDLRKFLHIYGSNKDFCVLEASSHALVQGRLFGVKFDMGGWLSFSQDHLDYHKTMDDYFAAKAMIFDHLKTQGKIFVPSREVELFKKVKKTNNKAEVAETINYLLPLFFSTKFNKSNLEVAVSIIQESFNLKVPDIFNSLIPPDGRFFIKSYKSNYIVVDFAHTPDALENVCQAICEAYPNHKLKVLFGCGGDRDRTKRPLMGKVAENYAAEVYVTSDNPRSENPEQIIDDIINGMTTAKVHRIVDRAFAVKKAFSDLKENEILLLAGKGHEDYIIKNGVKYPYSDIQEVEKFLQGIAND